MTDSNPRFFNTKKSLTAALALAGICTAALVSPTFAASSASDSIKDASLKMCVFQTYNRNNGTNLKKLTAKQLSSITDLNCDGRNIKSTTGLERLTGLKTLSLARNSISTIDLKKLTKLTSLNLTYNKLKSLDLSKQTKLADLHIEANKITSLDVRKNKNLTFVQADNILFTTNATATQAGSIYVLDLTKVPFFHAQSLLYTGGVYDYMDDVRLMATKDKGAFERMMHKGEGFDYVPGYTYRIKLPSATNVSMNTVAKQIAKLYQNHAQTYPQYTYYLGQYGITEPQTRSAVTSLNKPISRSGFITGLAQILGTSAAGYSW